MSIKDIPSGWLGLASIAITLLIGWGVMKSNQEALANDVKELKEEVRKDKDMANFRKLSQGFEGEFKELVDAVRDIEKKIEPECETIEK